MRKIYLLVVFLGLVSSAQTGIGTATPVNKLQVETAIADPATSGVAPNGNFRLSGTTGSHVLDFGLSSTSTYSWIQSRLKSNYATNYNLILNPNGGNVGIGTTNPTAKLNLVGGGIRIFNGLSNSATRPAINTSTIGNYEIRGVGSGGGAVQADGGDDGFLRLSAGGGTNANTQSSIDISGFSTVADMNSNIVMRTGGTDRIRITNTGNVGIGTTSPNSILTVGSSDGVVNGEITINPQGTTNEGGQITLRKSLSGGTTDWTIDHYGDNTTNARFRIFNGGSETTGIIIKESGNVGIGTIAPSARLQVAGDIIANSIAGSSDNRFKTNILPIENPLQKVMQLRGVTFDWKTKEFPNRMFSENRALGFIAQEVEQVIPEVVQTENNSEGFKSVQYDKVVALLVEAIKEQQKQIEQLQQKVKELTEKKVNEK